MGARPGSSARGRPHPARQVRNRGVDQAPVMLGNEFVLVEARLVVESPAYADLSNLLDRIMIPHIDNAGVL